MFKLIDLIVNNIEKFMILMAYLSVPFVFVIFFGYFNSKTNDIHIVVELVSSLILFININILYFILINKVNTILKILKNNYNEEK